MDIAERELYKKEKESLSEEQILVEIKKLFVNNYNSMPDYYTEYDYTKYNEDLSDKVDVLINLIHEKM